MPLLKKKRSDASDASSKLSLGGLFGNSRKRMNQQNDNINNKVVKQKTSKKMSSSNLGATVVCPDSPGRAISSSEKTKKAGRRIIKSSAPALSSVKNPDDKVIPLSTRLDSTTRIRSFGSSEYDLNSIPAAEDEARDTLPTPDSPSTPMRVGTSVHDHIYNLSVITDDILTSATDTVFDSLLCCASPVEACFEMPDIPSRVLEI